MRRRRVQTKPVAPSQVSSGFVRCSHKLKTTCTHVHRDPELPKRKNKAASFQILFVRWVFPTAWELALKASPWGWEDHYSLTETKEPTPGSCSHHLVSIATTSGLLWSELGWALGLLPHFPCLQEDLAAGRWCLTKVINQRGVRELSSTYQTLCQGLSEPSGASGAGGGQRPEQTEGCRWGGRLCLGLQTVSSGWDERCQTGSGDLC